MRYYESIYRKFFSLTVLKMLEFSSRYIKRFHTSDKLVCVRSIQLRAKETAPLVNKPYENKVTLR